MVAVEHNLAETPLPGLVVQLYEQRATGTLHVRDRNGDSRAYFDDGIPQGARLAKIANPLGQILRRLNWIPEAALNEALKQHHQTREPLGGVLIAKGVIAPEHLQYALQLQAQLNFIALFGVEVGTASLVASEARPETAPAAPMDPASAIYEGLRLYAQTPFLLNVLAEYILSAIVLKRAPPAAFFAALGPAEQQVIGLLSQPLFPGALPARVPLAERDIAALLVLLRACDLLEAVPPSAVQG